MKLGAFDSIYFHNKNFFGDGVFHRLIVYKPTFFRVKKRQRHSLGYWLEVKRFI